MISQQELVQLIPIASKWSEEQEHLILEHGIELTSTQKEDAKKIGVKHIDNVRLLKVAAIPSPSIPELKYAAQQLGFLTESTIAITFRYGIYIIPIELIF